MRASAACSPRIAVASRIAVALSSVACLAACAPDGETAATDTAWGGTIEERRGVVYVTNPEAGLWDDRSGSPIAFELEARFGAGPTPAAVLGRLAGVVVDNDGNVYALDAEAGQLVAFDPGGDVLWRAGRGGEGPQELADARGMVFDGHDGIIVLNQAGSRLDHWGVDGRYRKSDSLRELGLSRSYLGGYLPADRIALMTEVFETVANDYVVVRLAATPVIEARFRVSSEPSIPVPPNFIFQLSHHFEADKIFVGNTGRYVLRVFDTAGNLERHVSRPVEYLRRMGFASLDDGSTSGMSFGGLAAPIVLASGHWLVAASWPTNVDDPNAFVAQTPAQRPAIEWASSLDLFDPEGRFLTSLVTEDAPVPEIGRPWAVGADGALYTVGLAPSPHVRRYRVVIRDPS